MHTKSAYGFISYLKTLKQRSSGRVETSQVDSARALVSTVSVAVWRHTAIALSFCILGTAIPKDPYPRFWYRQRRKRLCRYPESFLIVSQPSANPSQQMPQPAGGTWVTLNTMRKVLLLPQGGDHATIIHARHGIARANQSRLVLKMPTSVSQLANEPLILPYASSTNMGVSNENLLVSSNK